MPNLPIKITQISKDFNLKSKDVLDAFKDIGVEKKSGGSADADEFEVFFAHLLNKHQIKDLDAYRDGRVKITSSSDKKEEKPAPKKETAAPAEKPAPAPKAEPAKKPETADKKPEAADKKPQPQQKPEFNKPARDGAQNGRENRPFDKQRAGGRDDNRRNDNRDRNDRGFNKYSAQPQENPFAKKLDNMNRAAQGFKSPNAQNNQNKDKFKKPEPQQTPVAAKVQPAPTAAPAPEAPKAPAVLPAQKAQLEKQQKKQDAPPISFNDHD